METLALAVSVVAVIAVTAGVFALGVLIGWRAKQGLNPIPTPDELRTQIFDRSEEAEFEISRKRGDFS